ncbi:TIGR03619 family F420-dependent LLM class oxidoreductase [Sphaerisporangium sp. TRM90804]|uniref:TIGR03619 family F420-dependent LLM class oxidoreductase n=1 Tax=Sphaerisporangium sp. TRM90804 TaxID=3031113 RepID=UPI00244915EF|nr:TIGR03619 family F420-dependent LLM class oxidoreductase [Sphaerisporangium sp. TRM90804]MDH2429165.1 TIGR03619 family F420-dependent LLM class oxidoreductase [Sphaerisporangium sp. TRM90804]
MKFAVSYNTAYHGVDPDRIIAYARHAEACGFEALYVPEHIALYPGAMFGAYEMPPSLPYADPLDCLSFVAAATSTLLLGTGVLLLPYHHPVVLAKRLATIDVLSKGRMRLLTVGLGTLPGEAQAMGVDFATRGRRADEAIDVMRLLWAGGEDGVSFAGEFFAFTDLCQYPKPYEATHLPIHIGGSSRAAARRAGRRGDGYFPGGALDPTERALQWNLAQTTAAEAGRTTQALQYTRWASTDLTPAQAEAHAAQGVTRLVVTPTTPHPARQHDELSALADRFALV